MTNQKKTLIKNEYVSFTLMAGYFLLTCMVKTEGSCVYSWEDHFKSKSDLQPRDQKYRKVSWYRLNCQKCLLNRQNIGKVRLLKDVISNSIDKSMYVPNSLFILFYSMQGRLFCVCSVCVCTHSFLRNVWFKLPKKFESFECMVDRINFFANSQ